MASAFDPGYTLVPEEEQASVDQQLDAALAGLTPSSDPDVTQPLGRGWAFDFATGEMVAHGTSPAQVFDTDNLRVWIEKTLRTHRFAHVIYSDNYGIDDPFQQIYGHVFTPAMTGRITQYVREALLVHDRIARVEDFTFDGGPLSTVLRVSFRVVLDDEAETTLDVADLPITPENQAVGG